MKLERAEWGNDLPSVELQLETQQHIHASVEELGSSVKEARLYEVGGIWNPLRAAGVAVRWSSIQCSCLVHETWQQVPFVHEVSLAFLK